MENKSAGNRPGTSKPTSPTSSAENPNDSSVDLFASVEDRMRNDMNEVKHIVTICRSASCHTERTSCPRIGSGSSAVCPSIHNNVIHSHFSRVSDRMLKMLDKLDNKIDRNVVDLAKLIGQDRVRIRDLEGQVKSIEEWQEMMTRERISTAAQQEPAIPPQGPARDNPKRDPPSVSAPAGRARRACDICGKDLSVPYVYKHQKQQHRTRK